jgi:hypothetical protein
MSEELESARRHLDEVHKRERDNYADPFHGGPVNDETRQKAWVERLQIYTNKKQALERIRQADPTHRPHDVAKAIEDCDRQIAVGKRRLGEPWSQM